MEHGYSITHRIAHSLDGSTIVPNMLELVTSQVTWRKQIISTGGNDQGLRQHWEGADSNNGTYEFTLVNAGRGTPRSHWVSRLNIAIPETEQSVSTWRCECSDARLPTIAQATFRLTTRSKRKGEGWEFPVFGPDSPIRFEGPENVVDWFKAVSRGNLDEPLFSAKANKNLGKICAALYTLRFAVDWEKGTMGPFPYLRAVDRQIAEMVLPRLRAKEINLNGE